MKENQESKKLQKKIAELEALLEKRTRELSLELTDNVMNLVELDTAATELFKRNNELKAVQHLAIISDMADLPQSDLYTNILNIIISGLRFPHLACAELQLGQEYYTTDIFRKTSRVIGSKLVDQRKMFGYLNVYYSEELSTSDEGPFTAEEKNLIATMSRYLSQISRRQQSEEQSRLFSTVIAQSSSAIIIADHTGATRYINDAFSKCMGYSMEEMEGNEPVRFMDCLYKDEENQKTFEELVNANYNGRQWQGEIRVIRKDQKVIWIQAVTFPLIKDQQINYFVSIFNDITDQKYQETLIGIIHQIDSLSNITTSLSDSLKLAFHYLKQIDWIDCGGIYLFDDDRKFLRLVYYEGLSEEYVKSVGVFSFDDMPAQVVLQMQPRYLGSDKYMEILHEQIKKEGLTFTASIPLIHQEEVIGSLNLGSRVFTEVNLLRRQVVESIASRLANLIVLVRTRQQLNLANEELSQTIRKITENQQLLIQKSKLESLGELVAGMAHEINQPLSVISLIMENIDFRLAIDQIDKIYMQKKINTINENINKIRTLIDHVRTFSRDQGTLLFEQVDVNKVILDSLSLIGAQLSHHQIKVTKQFGNNLGHTLGNASKLEQVIFNLISNARDALDEAGMPGLMEKPDKEILISTASVNHMIEIKIRDNGIGIPSGDLINVFNPFFTTKPEGRGTGLGLSIVYGIIAEMKGEIKIESDPGSFTEVTIQLPGYRGSKKK